MMRIAPQHPEAPPATIMDAADWIEYARELVVRASGARTKQCVVTCSFNGETVLDLSVDEGDKLFFYEGVSAPQGWLIVEQRNDDLGHLRGLVPASFVKPLDNEDEGQPKDCAPAPEPVSRETAATRLQARQRGRKSRKRTKQKLNGLLPAAIYGLD